MLSPIIERELRIALRQRGARKSRFRAAATGSGVVAFYLLMVWLGGHRSIGRNLHEWLFYIGLYLAIGPPFSISGGLFSEERRNQTLELLYLTGMNSAELFIGKLLGAALAASCDLLALSPLLAVPFLCGGVSLDLFLATIACLPVVFLFILSVGTFASAACKDDGTAQILMAIIIAVMSLSLPIPYNLGMGLYGQHPFSAQWLCLSPAYGPYLVWAKLGAGTAHNFWVATVVSLGWSLVFLGMAAVVLKRNWRRDLERSTFGVAPGPWQMLVQGTPDWRLALRHRLLGRNAFQWLAQRDRRAVVMAWGLIAGLTLTWLCGWATWPRAWPSSANFFTCALIFGLATNWIELHAAAQRIGGDRRDGALELLLTTPLRAEEIVDGQVAGLKAQFRPVRWTIFGLCIVMLWAGLTIRPWTTSALVSYFLIWISLLAFCTNSFTYSITKVMWIALNSGRPVFSVFASFGRPWIWLCWLLNLRNFIYSFGRGASKFPSGSYTELFLIILWSGLFGVYLLARRIGAAKADPFRKRLIGEMHSIASDPVPDPKDPRFKKWNVNTRFYPKLTYNFPELPRPFPRETNFG